MNDGICFENCDHDLTIVKNGETVLSAESLYSIVYDLLSVDCSLPEDWPDIRQKFDRLAKTYEICIGAECEEQLPKEIIDDDRYIEELREGEYFLERVIDPHGFVELLTKKLVLYGLVPEADFRIDYNRRFGRITVMFREHS